MSVWTLSQTFGVSDHVTVAVSNDTYIQLSVKVATVTQDVRFSTSLTHLLITVMWHNHRQFHLSFTFNAFHNSVFTTSS